MDMWVISTINSYEYNWYRHLFTNTIGKTFVFVDIHFHFSWVYIIPRSGIAGSYGNSILSYYWCHFNRVSSVAQWERICQQCRRCQFHLWVGKIPWRRKWQPTPIFLPGKSHGQRSLAGYSPWDCKESDMIEWLTHKQSWVVSVITMTLESILQDVVIP